MRRSVGAFALVAVVIAVSGCGDPDLWARYRAERAMWQAGRKVQLILVHPQRARPEDYQSAEVALEGVVATFPPVRWLTAERLTHSRARDVAMISGRAALELGELAAMRGDVNAALASYEATQQAFALLPAIALDAAHARATLLESVGRFADAVGIWEAMIADFSAVGPDGRVRTAVVDAPRRAAALLRELGRESDALRVLHEGERRLSEALQGRERAPTGAELWEAIAEVRAAGGAPDGALEAWRTMLGLPLDLTRRSQVRLRMAEQSLAEGRPDSVRSYVAPVIAAGPPSLRADALLLVARAWAARGDPDSALAVYDEVLERFPDDPQACPRARFGRGLVLQTEHRWEQARSEFRTLSVIYPYHPLAISALQRVVEYHARHGQIELARLEGNQALETLDRLIENQHDEDVQFDARLARARTLRAMDEPRRACDALAAFWRRYPRSPEGQEAGWEAAAVAESLLHDPERALSLYRELHLGPVPPKLRARAEGAMARLHVSGS